MQRLFKRPVFVLISLFVLQFSCTTDKVEPIFPQNNKIVDCKIITSSETQKYKLLDTNLWQSSYMGKDEIIVFSFFKPIYIQKINFGNNINTKVTSIKIYSNNGFLNEFSLKDIEINQTVSFLIIKVENIKNFLLTDAYLDTQKYSIAFNEFNSAIKLPQISFWKNDSTQIKLNIVKSVSETVSLPSFFPKQKIIDYTNNKKSLTLKSTGELIGFSNGINADTFYFGMLKDFSNYSKSANFSLNKFIFSQNSFEKENVNVKIFLQDNTLKSPDICSFMLDFKDDYFVDIATFDTNIVHDIRYATDNNFMEQAVYDCPYCLFRYRAAKDLKLASEEFQKMGLKIKVFDCYRPHSAQYKLWDIMPNINYVANPDKGSIHNRGAAVDLTLVDSTGKELNMGTEFDYFGFEAYSINLTLPDSILQNRFLLWETMHKYGFKEIKTEWWHMSHNSCLLYPISEMEFPCSN